MHDPYNHTGDLFDPFEGERLKREGMQAAADNVRSELEIARGYAKHLAAKHGMVTADDVMRMMFAGRGIDSLGPATGSLFRGPEWEFTGEWVKSKRTSNHRRAIRVWRLRETS